MYILNIYVYINMNFSYTISIQIKWPKIIFGYNNEYFIRIY